MLYPSPVFSRTGQMEFTLSTARKKKKKRTPAKLGLLYVAKKNFPEGSLLASPGRASGVLHG